jgi:RNA methyltransferase, TrmH family
MTVIVSPQNPRLKALRRLQTKRGRASAGAFLAEGEDLVAAAELGGRPLLEGYRLAGTGLGGERFLDVEAPALGEVSTLGSGTRVIGVYEQRWVAPAGPLCVYLHGVGDPGNVGTVLRSAQAFGASSVAFGPRCADPHSPKAVRASMGAIFSVPLARAMPDDLPGELVGLSADAADPLRGPLTGPVTLLIGSERHGLRPDLLARVDRLASLPQVAGDSLNAAMAATVALYELTRDPAGRPTVQPAGRSAG